MRLIIVTVAFVASCVFATTQTPPPQTDRPIVAGVVPHITSLNHKRSFLLDNPLARRDSTYNASTTYWFDQLIDHSNPSLGTFKQRYWFSDNYYGGQGSPILITTPGEQSAEGFYADLTGYSLTNALLQELTAAGVVLEHRYWGESSPYNTLTTDNLKYLTLDQSMNDIKYFVETASLPWASGGSYQSHPDTTPWISTGCSYPGLLMAYIQNKWPNLFAASWASSAPVQADTDFWEYYTPIEQGMPKNCSTDAGAVIDYVDKVLTTGQDNDKVALKTMFGMEQSQDDDFALTLSRVMWSWQSLQAYSFYYNGYDPFFQWCDAMEVKSDGTYPDEKGNGVEIALPGYAAYFKARYPDYYCPGGACFTSYDYTSTRYTDLSVGSLWNRQWQWMVCNEFGWFQTGDVGQGSRVVSKLVTVEYNLRQCDYQFPKADGTPGNYSPDANAINSQSSGWNIMADNLFVTNGQYDPWRSASVSSAYAPQHQESAYQKVVVIPGGHHCWDWTLANADLNSDVRAVVNTGLIQIKAWVESWYLEHPAVSHTPKVVPALVPSTQVTANAAATVNDTAKDDTVKDVTDSRVASIQPEDDNTRTTSNTPTDNNSSSTSTSSKSPEQENESLRQSASSLRTIMIASLVTNGVLTLLVVALGLVWFFRMQRARKGVLMQVGDDMSLVGNEVKGIVGGPRGARGKGDYGVVPTREER